ncbi:MAG: Na+/H+ antiporter NhaC [Cyanobacteriota bacterium]
MPEEKIKKPHISAIFIILGYLMFAMALSLKGGIPIEITLASVVILSAIISMLNGFTWQEVESAIIDGCKIAIIPVIILMTIGVLIASWMMGGIVPYLIYLGLKFLSPEIFLPSTLIICCITSLATGSSWTTVGTVGIALLGVGASLDISLPMVVGCIVSGAFFGDKMSPLSDSTNLAAAVAETNLFDHIKHMMWTTIPALVIALIIYSLLCLGFQPSLTKTDELSQTLNILNQNFKFGIWNLIPPALVLILAFKKVSALPTLIIAVALGLLYGIFIEGHSLLDATKILNEGYKSHTGIERIDELLSRGGLQSMMRIISIAFLGLGLGGIMEKTRMLETLISGVSKYLTSAKTLIPTTLIASWIAAMLLASLYMAIIIPGRMFLPVYKKLKLENINLSRTLEDGGTMISPLLPWGFSGIFVAQALGIPTIEYVPYTFLNLLVPVFTILWAVTGIGITYCKEESETTAYTG